MKIFKRIIIVGICIVALLLAALLIIPFFVDINTYKPVIEKRVTTYTGRPFRLGGDLKLTLFPWAGVTLNDLHFGNTGEFGSDDMVSIQSFEVRMKLLPLLSKKVEIKRFVVNEPHLALQKAKSGKGNWEGIGPAKTPTDEQPADQGPDQPEADAKKGLPIASFNMETFALKNGTVIWQDRSAGVKKRITNFNFFLDDVTLVKPVGVRLSANVDKKSISLEGKVGPIGKEPGKGKFAVDLVMVLLNQLTIKLDGTVANPVSGPVFAFTVDIPKFSPRKLAADAGMEFPVQTADQKVLGRLSLKTSISGDRGSVSFRNGRIVLDDSTADFSLTAKEFHKPNISCKINMDRINVDRYLPAKDETAKAEAPPASKSAGKEPKKTLKTDYTPLRKLVLHSDIAIGQLIAAKATMEDIVVKIVAKNGVFTINPASLKLYEGDLATNSIIDFRKSKPAVTTDLDLKNVQIGPLVQDLMDRDIIEGASDALIHLNFKGESAAGIKRSLSGNGNFTCSDGALKGIDLEAMMRNTAAAFGIGTQTQHQPKTIFSTLDSQFTINRGLLDNPKTSMIAERIRVMAHGKADIVKETLNFRIEPKYLEKSEDKTNEIIVPVLVGGTFDSPKFFPDVKAALQQEYMQSPEMKKKLKKLGIEEKEQKIIEDVSDQLLKGLNLGN